MAIPAQMDAIGVKTAVLAAQSVLSVRQLESCLADAGFDMDTITTTTGPNQSFVPTDQYVRFNQAIAAKCGEPVLRLLYYNNGTSAARDVMLMPHFQTVKDRYTTGSPAERLEQTLRALIAVVRAGGWSDVGPERVAGHTNRWQFRVPVCFYCVGLTTTRPICSSATAFYKQLLSWASSVPLTVDEIACRATGAPECLYEVVLLESGREAVPDVPPAHPPS